MTNCGVTLPKYSSLFGAFSKVQGSKVQVAESGRTEERNFALWSRCIPTALNLESKWLNASKLCCNKPILQRPLVKEQNSRDKNSFPERNHMWQDSLAELRNTHFDKDILTYSIRKRARNHQPLRCWPVDGWIICHHREKTITMAHGWSEVCPPALKESICGPRSLPWYQ
jgi:hypothetical protein